MTYSRTEFLADCTLTIGHALRGRRTEVINSVSTINQKMKMVFRRRTTDYLESKYENKQLDDPRKTLANMTLETLKLKGKQPPPEEHYSAKVLTPLVVKDAFNWVVDHKIHTVAICTFGYYFRTITCIGLLGFGFYKIFD